jgi:hypothetical protein
MTAASFGFINTSNLRRVRKADVARQSFVKADGLDTCLNCWKGWMGSDADRDLGVKTMRGLVGEGFTHLDIYEAQQEADDRIAVATDAMINSLERIHVWAIYRACSISSVWRYPNANLVQVAYEAKKALKIKLQMNSATAILF